MSSKTNLIAFFAFRFIKEQKIKQNIINGNIVINNDLIVILRVKKNNIIFNGIKLLKNIGMIIDNIIKNKNLAFFIMVILSILTYIKFA